MIYMQLISWKGCYYLEVFHAHSKEESESLWDEWVRLALQSKVQEITKFAKVQNRSYNGVRTKIQVFTGLEQAFLKG